MGIEMEERGITKEHKIETGGGGGGQNASKRQKETSRKEASIFKDRNAN